MADVEASRDDLILNAILRLGGRVLLIDVVVTPASPLPLRRHHSETDCSVHLTTSDLFLWMPPLFSPLAEAIPSSESLPTCRFIFPDSERCAEMTFRQCYWGVTIALSDDTSNALRALRRSESYPQETAFRR